MSIPDPAGPLPENPRDFLSMWTRSRGNVRHFIEDTIAPPLNDDTQRAAGEAAAAAAIASTYGMDIEDFIAGLDAVTGSLESAGTRHLTQLDPDTPIDTGTAAFFDVDNTLIQGSSLVELGLGMARRRFFRIRDVAPFAWKQLKFRVSGTENIEDVAAGRSKALELIRGKKVEDLIALGESIVDSSMLRKIYAGTVEMAKMHIEAGQQVWLVTATPVQLAQILATRLGFTGALGTVPETVNGRFTGRLMGDILHGPGKAHAVAALASLEGLDLSQCTAYSDSSNDLPLLSMVGTAVAINPDRALKKEAAARGWAIRDYRNLRMAVSRYGLLTVVATALGMAAVHSHKNTKSPGA